MSSYKSLKELKELFNNFVDSEFINYPPNHSWMVQRDSYDSDTSEIISSNFSGNMTLYSILAPIIENGYETPYQLYESCVSRGEGFSDELTAICGGGDQSISSFSIKYVGPLGPETEKIQNITETAQSLALESISIITKITERNEVDKLYEIRSYLENI